MIHRTKPLNPLSKEKMGDYYLYKQQHMTKSLEAERIV